MKTVSISRVFYVHESAVVVIPKKARQELPGFEPGNYVRILTDGRRIILEPLDKSAKRGV